MPTKAMQIKRDRQEYVRRRAEKELEWKLEINHLRFERLWRKAHRKGKRAMHAAKESPGWCSVHVRIPDGLFASWLMKTGKAKYSADFSGNQGAVRVFISFGTSATALVWRHMRKRSRAC
jgi:hypothetical protein